MSNPGLVMVVRRAPSGYEAIAATICNGYRLRVIKTRKTADLARKAATNAIDKMMRQIKEQEEKV